MEQLPIDLIGEILSHIDLKEQRFARCVNKKFSISQIGVNQLCSLPAITEIIDWLWKEKQLLVDEETRIDSKIYRLGKRLGVDTFSCLLFGPTRVIIYIDQGYMVVKQHGFRHEIKLTTQEDFINYVENQIKRNCINGQYGMIFESNPCSVIENWWILRYIYADRQICVKRGFDPDLYFLNYFKSVFTRYLSSTYVSDFLEIFNIFCMFHTTFINSFFVAFPAYLRSINSPIQIGESDNQLVFNGLPENVSERKQLQIKIGELLSKATPQDLEPL